MMSGQGEQTIFDASDAASGGAAVMKSEEFAPVKEDDVLEVTMAPGPDAAAGTAASGGQSAVGGGEAQQPGIGAMLKRGAAVVMGMVPTDVNARFETFRTQQSNSMKPWAECVGAANLRAAYACAAPQYIPARITSNLKRYLWNYVAVFGLTFAVLAFVVSFLYVHRANGRRATAFCSCMCACVFLWV